MPNKQRILNHHQLNNISVLTPIEISTLKQGDWRNASTTLLRCVKCGHHRISAPIAAWFGYRGELMLCYECQKLTSHSYCGPTAIREIIANKINSLT